MSEVEEGNIIWDSNIDKLLANWCDNAKCFEWMHTETHDLYAKRSKEFMVSINCLTALAGVSNVIAGGITINGFQIAWLFGGISIFASTLTMLQDKLGYQQASVVHGKMASSWTIIRSKIEEVITIPYSGRQDCKTFLKYIKADINQLTVDGNKIPKNIRMLCYNKFKSIVGFDIPDICGGMEHTKVYVAANTNVGSHLLEA